MTMGGLPCSAAADEMLMEGEGRVRAMLSSAGNPMVSWPDELKTEKALKSLGEKEPKIFIVPGHDQGVVNADVAAGAMLQHFR